jgi:lipopolysaccharide assembly protein A
MRTESITLFLQTGSSALPPVPVLRAHGNAPALRPPRGGVMARILLAILFLVLLILGLSFAVLNSTSVPLNYYLGKVDLPLALVVVGSLILGAILGVLVSLGIVIRLKRQVRHLRRQVQTAEKEVSNLRAIPLKDSH